jgi:hypothetical protein
LHKWEVRGGVGNRRKEGRVFKGKQSVKDIERESKMR